VSDRIRTGDRLDHNQELYQLSYAHRAPSNVPGDSGGSLLAELASCMRFDPWSTGDRDAAGPAITTEDRRVGGAKSDP
jgi:hypothetical protein